MDKKSLEKSTITLLLLFKNLSNIPRSGYILASGAPLDITPNVLEHTIYVTVLSDIFGDIVQQDYEVNKTKILEISIFHDIEESILLDLPEGPTYRSLLGGEKQIKRNIHRRARKKVLSILPEDKINKLVGILEDNSRENTIVHIADLVAMLFEILILLNRGHKHPWFDIIWKINEEKILNLVKELDSPSLEKYINKLLMELRKVKDNPEFLGKYHDIYLPSDFIRKS